MKKDEDKFCLVQITLDDMKKEVVREIGMRQKVYPGWIENGKISKQTADYRILVLEAVALELEMLIKAKNPQRILFDEF